ncbi:unnamed protein product, partial [Scytosiphon promiscuus]
ATAAAAAAAAGAGAARRRRSERNFDNDDCSRGDGDEDTERHDGHRGDNASVDRADFWLQPEYSEASGGPSKPFDCNGYGGCNGSRGAGGGTGLKVTSSRCSSATAEDPSWNSGMMGGSSSRSCLSSRGGSG